MYKIIKIKREFTTTSVRFMRSPEIKKASSFGKCFHQSGLNELVFEPICRGFGGDSIHFIAHSKEVEIR